MNERIAALAREAGITLDAERGIAIIGPLEIEALVKLVAKDCADSVGLTAAEIIRERYGL